MRLFGFILISLFQFAVTATPASALDPTTTFSILTYNIRIGLGREDPGRNVFKARHEQHDLRPIIAAIRSTRAQIVALQEVLGERQAREIADALGMQFVYTRHGPVYGKWWGLAVLSKFPIENSKSLPISTGRGNTRSDLLVLVRISGQTVHVINVHTDKDLKDGSPIRRTMANANDIDGPVVVLGDFNARPNAARLDPVRARLRDAVVLADAMNGSSVLHHSTFQHADTLVRGKRIDYIFIDDRYLKVHRVGLLGRQHWPASDHIGVTATLSLIN
jgi:endonuclease/exonuclease/phosphatase family metal-dependent hydrolase